MTQEEKELAEKAFANVKWQIEQTCKYQLPCGICDKTGEICSWIGRYER